MVGRALLKEDQLAGLWLANPSNAKRRQVLRETLEQFESCPEGDRYQSQAQTNLARWQRQCPTGRTAPGVLVLPGDWGVVTQSLTEQFGACFAVLNMANAEVPGGAYVEGAVAQEENIYRRSDCHFYVAPPEYDVDRDRYTPEATRLISGEDGVVYLDSRNPRVCIRGPEDRLAEDLGYRWLTRDEMFPFYELKSAAQDLRDGSAFDPVKARRQIRAQITTLQSAGIRHVVFGAFGCGAFKNPAGEVAQIYREELGSSRRHFDVVAFAIFNAGYGPGNYEPFKSVLGAS